MTNNYLIKSFFEVRFWFNFKNLVLALKVYTSVAKESKLKSQKILEDHSEVTQSYLLVISIQDLSQLGLGLSHFKKYEIFGGDTPQSKK